MRSQDIYEHQIKTLVRLVQRWQDTTPPDPVLEKKVRDFVSFELVGRGAADVVTRALGELEGPAADSLEVMLSHCSQTFYQTDSVWRAFAVPIAVCWGMKPHRIYVAKRGHHEYLNQLAAGIKQCTGARDVYLDGAIYSANTLFNLNARMLHQHLQGMVLGAGNGRRGLSSLPSMELRSSSEPPWRVVYFLGVEVQGGNAKSSMDDAGVQDAMQGYLELGAHALTMPSTPTFDQGAHGETICHPPLYLQDAIRFGEKAIRGYRLRQLLQEITRDEKAVALNYAFNSAKYAIEVILLGKWLGYEMRWLLMQGETEDDFLRDVQQVLDSEITSSERTLVPIELEELIEARMQSKLASCWPRRR